VPGGDRPVTKPSDVDPSLQKNYRPLADKYERLAELGEARATERRAQRDELAAEVRQQNKLARESQKSLDQTNEGVELLTQSVQLLEAQENPDEKTLKELELAREGLKNMEEMQEGQQLDHERRLRELTENETKLGELKAEVAQLEESTRHFEEAASYADQADRNQKVANIAMEGDPEATRAAVFAEAEKHNDTYREYATKQAETFETLRRTQADVKSFDGELKRSLKDQERLEAEVRKYEIDGPPDKLGGAMRDLEFRRERTEGLQEKLAAAKEAVPQLEDENTRLDALAKFERKQTDDVRKLAESDPSVIETEFRTREEIGEFVEFGTVLDADKQVAQELEFDGPVTKPEAVSDAGATVDELDGLTPAASNGSAAADDEAMVEVPPQIVDEEMLAEPAPTAANAAAEGVPPEPSVEQETVDLTTEEEPVYAEAESTSDAGAYEESGVAEETYEPEPEPEPDFAEG
jgi:hypothetical protein